MRLWHKALIPVLPRQQLLAQWRECCCIARHIAVNGTPHHILVNPILDYPMSHFYTYCNMVCIEMEARGYRNDFSKLEQWLDEDVTETVSFQELFEGWHTRRYFVQCFYNLQEKYDRGGITEEEWSKIHNMQYVSGGRI